MGDFFSALAISFVVFMAVDLLWLGVLARNFYRDRLGKLMVDKPVWPAATLFYLLFLVGLVYFAIDPAATVGEAARDGALYGLFTYMTYELTNWAVIANWPRRLVLPDIVWGMVLSTSVASATFWIMENLL